MMPPVPPSRDRGLSLIELVVTMAVFALVAVMGLQALSGTLRLRDGLTVRAEAAGTLSLAAGLLRQDLASVMPLSFYPPGGASPQSAMRQRPDKSGFAMSISGQHPLSGPDGGLGLGRAEWRVVDGQLIRRVWPTLYPADPRQISPPVVVLDGVTGLSLRSYWNGIGWIDGLRPAQLGPGAGYGSPAGSDEDGGAGAPEVYSDLLPIAVELTLLTRDHGQLVLLEATP